MNISNDNALFERSNSWNFGKKDINCHDSLASKIESYFPTSSWLGLMHGLDFLGRLKGYLKKCLWISFLLTMITISFFLTIYTMGEYIEAKTITLYRIKTLPFVKYHGITLCPKYSDGYNISGIKQKLLTIDNFLTNDEMDDFLVYLSAGGGFDNYDNFLEYLDDEILMNFENILQKVVKSFGSLKNLYNFVFEEQNFNCNDFFDECYFGDRKKNCCEMFEATFVLIRGKCFKMKEYYQTSPDELDKISLVLKPIWSNFIRKSKFQEQVVVYNSQRKKYVSYLSRFYIYGNNWNRLRFQKDVYYLLNNNGRCNSNHNYEGLSMCLIDTWLKTKLHNPYNCTLFYMEDKKFDVCNPIIILKNYKKIMSLNFNDGKCLQACTYEEIKTEFVSKLFSHSLAGIRNENEYRIRIEFSYLNMNEYIYQEINKMTATSFISELGGYTGLFLDLNILSLLQGIIILIKYIYRKFLKKKIDGRVEIGL